MITESDSFNTIEFDKYFAILPSGSNKEKFKKHYNATDVPIGFKYNSETNSEWVSIEEMRDLIKKYVDPNFKPLA